MNALCMNPILRDFSFPTAGQKFLNGQTITWQHRILIFSYIWRKSVRNGHTVSGINKSNGPIWEKNSGKFKGPQVGLKLKRHTEILRMSNMFVWRGHAIVFNSLVVTGSLGVCLDLKKYEQLIAIIIIIIMKIIIIIIVIIDAMKRNNFNRNQRMVSPCFWRPREKQYKYNFSTLTLQPCLCLYRPKEMTLTSGNPSVISHTDETSAPNGRVCIF